jgi:hypothetical protein
MSDYHCPGHVLSSGKGIIIIHWYVRTSGVSRARVFAVQWNSYQPVSSGQEGLREPQMAVPVLVRGRGVAFVTVSGRTYRNWTDQLCLGRAVRTALVRPDQDTSSQDEAPTSLASHALTPATGP